MNIVDGTYLIRKLRDTAIKTDVAIACWPLLAFQFPQTVVTFSGHRGRSTIKELMMYRYRYVRVVDIVIFFDDGE